VSEERALRKLVQTPEEQRRHQEERQGGFVRQARKQTDVRAEVAFSGGGLDDALPYGGVAALDGGESHTEGKQISSPPSQTRAKTAWHLGEVVYISQIPYLLFP
jgi:hypothetical protein